MTSRRVICALLGLGFGLLFYLAFRTDHTLSNRVVLYFAGAPAYGRLHHGLAHWLPVPLFLRGSLPSALWCYVVTCLIGGWQVRVAGRWSLSLRWLPPVFNAAWEIVQGLGWTDGHMDPWDAVAGVAGWLLAEIMFFRAVKPREKIGGLLSWRVGVVIAGIACMGCADVWR